MKYAYFASTGRTGTDFFTKLFNDVVENCWSLHEPRPAFRRKASKLISRPYSFFDCAYFKIPRIYRHLRRKEEWYVETNYHLFAAIPLIRKAFPESLVFHLVRDGRDVTTSWLNRFRYITNDHIVPVDIPGDKAREYWETWNPLQKLAWYWKTVNNHILTTPSDLMVKFEDIFQGEKKGCFQILDMFEGIEYRRERVMERLSEKVNENKRDFFPKYQEWPDKWKEQFWEIAGETMESFGYKE